MGWGWERGGLKLREILLLAPRLFWNKEVLPPAGCIPRVLSCLSGFSQGEGTGRETGKQEKRKSLDVSTPVYITCTASWKEMPDAVQSSTAWPQPLRSHKNCIQLFKCTKSTCWTPQTYTDYMLTVSQFFQKYPCLLSYRFLCCWSPGCHSISYLVSPNFHHLHMLCCA